MKTDGQGTGIEASKAGAPEPVAVASVGTDGDARWLALGPGSWRDYPPGTKFYAGKARATSEAVGIVRDSPDDYAIYVDWTGAAPPVGTKLFLAPQAVPEVRPLPISEPTEREAFEKWQLSLRRPPWMLERRTTTIAAGEYRDDRMEADWEAWKARAAHPISEQGSDRVRAALAELVAVNDGVRSWKFSDDDSLKVHADLTRRYVLAWEEARAALATSERQAAVTTQADRIEAKLDSLIKSLDDEPEDEEQEGLTLDGDPAGRERDQTESLG